jgi:hypothetical protein
LAHYAQAPWSWEVCGNHHCRFSNFRIVKLYLMASERRQGARPLAGQHAQKVEIFFNHAYKQVKTVSPQEPIMEPCSKVKRALRLRAPSGMQWSQDDLDWALAQEHVQCAVIIGDALEVCTACSAASAKKLAHTMAMHFEGVGVEWACTEDPRKLDC